MSSLIITAKLIVTEIHFGFVRIFKYPIKLLFDSLLFYIIFLGLALGIRSIAPYPMPGAELAGALAGFLLWFWALIAIDSMGQSVMEDTQVGTLEQVCVSAADLRLVLLGRFVGVLVTGSITIAIVLTGVMLSTGARLYCDLTGFLICLGIITIVTFGLAGLGYMVASLVLLVKRIGNLMTLFQFGLLFLVLAPTDNLPPILSSVVKGVPLVWGSDLIAAIISASSRPSLYEIGGLLAVCSCWLLVGAIAFKRVEHSARRRGLVGHY